MKFDPTLTYSFIISIVAIISPILVALINSKLQLKLKKLEFFEDNNNKILFNFIDATLDCKNNKINFYKAYNRVYLYCNIWGSIKPLPLKIIKDLVEKDASIEKINKALNDFVYIANQNKEQLKIK